MICFIVSAMLGLYFGNDPIQTLINSLLVMGASFIVGLVLGAIAQRSIDEQIMQHKQDNPIPESDSSGTESTDPRPKAI